MSSHLSPISATGMTLSLFLTTKGDAGTGLGLSTVHGTINKIGGTIELVSKPGEGTPFTIKLPVALA